MFKIIKQEKHSTVRRYFFIIIILTCILLLFTYLNTEFMTKCRMYLDDPPKNFDFKMPLYTWTCLNEKCVKQLSENEHVSLISCKMMCSEPPVWPKPRSLLITNRRSSVINKKNFFFKFNGSPASVLLNKTVNIFMKNPLFLNSGKMSGCHLIISIHLRDPSINRIKLTTNESYHLKVKNLVATIVAENYFGARHALETLLQLIWYDDIVNELRILHDVDIIDYPAFPYRGVMIDTARNFFPLPLIKNVVSGMAMSKLNVLHLHLTDSASFPILLPRIPKLALFGAYGPDMIYTPNDIKELVDFSLIRGVRVLLEVDAPSHINAGWSALDPNLVICDEKNFFNGHLNLRNKDTLFILNQIYADLLELSENNEFFHIGNDINFSCWPHLDLEEPVERYWADYTNKMIQKLKAANNDKYPEHIIMWSSSLTDSSVFQTLDFNVTVQFSFGNLFQILKQGHKIIYSSAGHWFLNCNFDDTIPGLCNSYNSWQEFYTYRPWVSNGFKELALGGEVCLWSEKVETDTLETMIWPRSAAFAERVWSDLENMDNDDVSSRLVTFTERLKYKGIKVAGMWARWCSQNPGKC